MKTTIIKLVTALFIACLLSMPGFFLAGHSAGRASPLPDPLLGPQPRPQQQPLPQQPQHGWTVCAVLNVGIVPGVPDPRQLFELCHGDGWRLQAYCLNPGVDLPPLNAHCSETAPNRFWCGDGVQELQSYGILQAPEDTPTPTVTATATATAAATGTNTPLPTATQVTATPTPTQPSAAAPSETPTYYYRPRAGGPGNVEVLLSFLFWGVLITTTVAVGWWARKWYERSLED